MLMVRSRRPGRCFGRARTGESVARLQLVAPSDWDPSRRELVASVVEHAATEATRLGIGRAGLSAGMIAGLGNVAGGLSGAGGESHLDLRALTGTIQEGIAVLILHAWLANLSSGDAR